MSQAWEPLTRDEYDAVWDRFFREFAFHPSVHPDHFPGIREPRGSVTWALWPSPWREGDEEALQEQFLAAFRACTAADETIYALDWQHLCYWLRPHRTFEEWTILVLPNGDYHIFLSRDFSWGVFGHPWEWTVCVFGEPLLHALHTAGEPAMLASILRRG